MAYNVENLFWSVGKYETLPDLQHRANNDTVPQRKSDEDIETIRKIIKQADPDIAILTEVESIVALQKLAQDSLGNYDSYLIEGNDARGIDIGFIIKKDLPFLVEHQSHKDETWFDPITRKDIKLFSRDAPALLFRKNKSEPPFLIVMGNHAKSKRDRAGDPESRMIRTAQYDRIAEIVERYKRTYGPQVPILLGGDFNTDVNTSPELNQLNKSLTSSFNVAKISTPKDQRITHTFHPRDGPTHKSQMDDIRVNTSLADAIIEAKVIRYQNPDGTIMPFASTFDERSKQPSDHLPVFIRLLTNKLF